MFMRLWVKDLEEEFKFNSLVELNLILDVKTCINIKKRKLPMTKSLITFSILILLPMLAYGQSDVAKMLQDIDGKVDEIVIKSDGKEYKFNGDEAEKLFSAMKNEKEIKSFSFITKDGQIIEGDSSTKKIIITELGQDIDDSNSQVLVFVDEDSDSGDVDVNKIEKKVIVTNEGDKKVVKVTTTENGKENIEVYEGKAADEYLEKMKSENEIKVNVDIKEEDGKKIKKIVIEKEVE